jgi:ferric-dicitrate binding protein FerR (iron transport regulator)
MNTPRNDKEFVDTAKQSFDASVEQLDAATLSKLNQARQRALSHARQPSRRYAWSRMAPAAGIAAAAAVAIFMMQQPGLDNTVMAPSTASDFELLLDEHELDMFEELEFFALMGELEERSDVG